MISRVGERLLVVSQLNVLESSRKRN